MTWNDQPKDCFGMLLQDSVKLSHAISHNTDLAGKGLEGDNNIPSFLLSEREEGSIII